MKKKTAALMTALILAVSLSACGNTNKEVKTSSENKEENQEEESVVESETSGKCGNDAVWSYKDGVVTIKGTGDAGGYHFTFYTKTNGLNDKIEKIIIENGITRIGEFTFQHCSNLKEVSLPDTLISIGENAFCECNSLTEITIPSSVTSIEQKAFNSCSSLKQIDRKSVV